MGLVESDNLTSSIDAETSTSQQQSDWSVIWECFEKPHILLANQDGGLSKNMQDLVRNAVGEMRRYYSRKVVDVLVRVTRQSLDGLRRRFSKNSGEFVYRFLNFISGFDLIFF